MLIHEKIHEIYQEYQIKIKIYIDTRKYKNKKFIGIRKYIHEKYITLLIHENTYKTIIVANT